MLGGVGGRSERTNRIAIIKVIAVGINQIIFIIEISSELITISGVIDKPMQLPRTMASVIPPLAMADSLIGNHSLVTCMNLYIQTKRLNVIKYSCVTLFGMQNAKTFPGQTRN